MLDNMSSKFDIGRTLDKMKQKLNSMSGFSSHVGNSQKPTNNNDSVNTDTNQIPTYKKPIYQYIPVPPTTESLRIRCLIEWGRCDYIKPSDY